MGNKFNKIRNVHFFCTKIIGKKLVTLNILACQNIIANIMTTFFALQFKWKKRFSKTHKRIEKLRRNNEQ